MQSEICNKFNPIQYCKKLNFCDVLLTSVLRVSTCLMYYHTCCTKGILFPTSNSDTFASELLENPEEYFLVTNPSRKSFEHNIMSR